MPRDFESRHGSAGDGAEEPGRRGVRAVPPRGRPRGSGLVPGPCAVPELAPVRLGVRGGFRLPRVARGRRRLAATGLAVAAAALATQLARGGGGGASAAAGPDGERPRGPSAAAQRPDENLGSRRARTSAVSAPVRIADAAAARLLRPGDRVDVIAGAHGPEPARAVARCARVDRMPRSVETDPVGAEHDGALVVLRVPRGKATALAGAGAAGRLAVTLC